MGRVANAAVIKQWRERMGRWRRSGISIAEFCRHEQVSQPSFFNWRKRLSRQRTSTSRRPAGSSGSSKRPPQFVQLPAATWPGFEGIQIALPGGAIVTLPPQAGAELVTTAIRAAVTGGVAENRPC